MNKRAEIKQTNIQITRFIIYDLLKNGGYVKKKSQKAIINKNGAEIKK